MILSRVFRFAMAFAILIAAVTAAPVQQASARTTGHLVIQGPDAAPAGYDHILCYVAAFQNPFTPVNVTLRDQFYPNGFVAGLQLDDTACTPAKKVLDGRKPIKVKPNGHYVCYPFTSSVQVTDQTRAYMNQLESNTALFYQPEFLCVPTYKYLASDLRNGDAGGQPDNAPKGFTHLMGYDDSYQGAAFANPLPATTVTLFDQFHPYPNAGFTVGLGNPFMLLTPTKKTYKKGKKVVDNGHWVVYYFPQPTAVNQTRDYVNQLERNTVNVFFPNFLFVPTYKSPTAERTPRRLYRGGRAPIPATTSYVIR
jgi:hypothetical protein